MKAQTAGLLTTVAVGVIIVSGFIPIITTLNVSAFAYPETKTTSVPYTAVQTTQSPSVSTSTTLIAQQSVTTEVNNVYSISSTTLDCNNYVYEYSSMSQGTDVQVSFSASGNLYLYVFTSGQYAAFSVNGNTSPNVAEIDSQSSGSTSFHVSQNDLYYLVVLNKPGFLGCFGVAAVGLYSASGTSTYVTTVTYYVTQTNTKIYYVPVTTTVTFYSQSTYTTTLTSTTTLTCKVGWLQAIFGCH